MTNILGCNQEVKGNVVYGNLNVTQYSNNEDISFLIRENFILLNKLELAEKKNKILISKMRYLINYLKDNDLVKNLRENERIKKLLDNI